MYMYMWGEGVGGLSMLLGWVPFFFFRSICYLLVCLVCYTHVFSCTQDESALYDAALRGDVSAVQLIASHVNVDCTPYEVCVTFYVQLCNVRDMLYECMHISNHKDHVIIM